MNLNIVCSSCEESFESLDEGTAMWLVCPHCGARTPNPQRPVHRAKENLPIAGFGVFARLLLVVASLGTLVSGCGGFCLIPLGLNAQVFLGFFGFLAAMLTAIVLVRMDYGARHGGGELVGQSLVLAVLGVFAGLGAIVFAFAVCAG